MREYLPIEEVRRMCNNDSLRPVEAYRNHWLADRERLEKCIEALKDISKGAVNLGGPEFLAQETLSEIGAS